MLLRVVGEEDLNWCQMQLYFSVEKCLWICLLLSFFSKFTLRSESLPLPIQFHFLIFTWNSNIISIWFLWSVSCLLIACAKTRGLRTVSFLVSLQVCTICCIPVIKNQFLANYSPYFLLFSSNWGLCSFCTSWCLLFCFYWCSAMVAELAQNTSLASSVNNGKNLENTWSLILGNQHSLSLWSAVLRGCVIWTKPHQSWLKCL